MPNTNSAFPPTTLESLLSDGPVDLLDDGLRLQVKREWIIPTEDRLSYATILRLVECCRELHWTRDVATVCPTADAILTKVAARFHQPVLVQSLIQIHYAVTRIRPCSYDLEFRVILSGSAVLCATVEMRNAFYDSDKGRSVRAPNNVLTTLQSLLGPEKRRP